MKRFLFGFIIVALLAVSAAALDIPKYSGPITDLGGLLDPSAKSTLEAKLLDYRRQTGNEIGVLIIKSLDGAGIEDYAHDVFAKWGIGKSGKDNGVLLLIALNDRKIKIEIGYGLEAEFTDLEEPTAACFFERSGHRRHVSLHHGRDAGAVFDGRRRGIRRTPPEPGSNCCAKRCDPSAAAIAAAGESELETHP